MRVSSRCFRPSRTACSSSRVKPAMLNWRVASSYRCMYIVVPLSAASVPCRPNASTSSSTRSSATCSARLLVKIQTQTSDDRATYAAEVARLEPPARRCLTPLARLVTLLRSAAALQRQHEHPLHVVVRLDSPVRPIARVLRREPCDHRGVPHAQRSDAPHLRGAQTLRDPRAVQHFHTHQPPPLHATASLLSRSW